MKALEAISVVFFLLPVSAYCQEDYRDPFVSLLPKEQVEEAAQEKVKEALDTLPVVIEGVLWGTDSPSVIINGEVYSVGDRFNLNLPGEADEPINSEVKVVQIKNNVVFLACRGKVYKLTVENKIKQ